MAENKSFWSRLFDALWGAIKDKLFPPAPPKPDPVEPPPPPVVEPPVTPDPPPVEPPPVTPPPVEPPPVQPPAPVTVKRVGIMRPQGGPRLPRGDAAMLRIEVEYSDGNVLRGGEGLKGVTGAIWRAQAGGQVATISDAGANPAQGFSFGPIIFANDKGAAANLKTTATAPAGKCKVSCEFKLDGVKYALPEDAFVLEIV